MARQRKSKLDRTMNKKILVSLQDQMTVEDLVELVGTSVCYEDIPFFIVKLLEHIGTDVLLERSLVQHFKYVEKEYRKDLWDIKEKDWSPQDLTTIK